MTKRQAMKRILLILVVTAAAVMAFVVGLGPERVWQLSGPADLGPVDFATLQRRDSPNDALACRPGLCGAEADIEAPVFGQLPEAMVRIVEEALAGEPSLENVSRDAAGGTLRFVQRSALMRFPDTIDVKVVPLPEGGSAVLLYSRSQLGRGDMGVNRARITRWIGLIAAAAGK